jgi:hypothetical protein
MGVISRRRKTPAGKPRFAAFNEGDLFRHRAR